jgi:hypothetical protein
VVVEAAAAERTGANKIQTRIPGMNSEKMSETRAGNIGLFQGFRDFLTFEGVSCL